MRVGMTKKLIKICGIHDPDIAVAAARAGANYIGIIFHSSSPRHVNIEQAVNVAEASRRSGATPVAVFVNQTDVEMRLICEATHIKTVQLHGEIARAHHHLLPDDYQRIYVSSESDNNLHHLDKERDFILIDHREPGQGKSINWMKFQYHLPFRWFLAGGLTSVNVQHAIDVLQPDGVDVSSGVESSRGNKDISLIQQFIASVQGHYGSQ